MRKALYKALCRHAALLNLVGNSLDKLNAVGVAKSLRVALLPIEILRQVHFYYSPMNWDMAWTAEMESDGFERIPRSWWVRCLLATRPESIITLYGDRTSGQISQLSYFKDSVRIVARESPRLFEVFVRPGDLAELKQSLWGDSDALFLAIEPDAETNEPTLAFSRVHAPKRYTQSFKVPLSNRSVLLVGPSGAGKSTTVLLQSAAEKKKLLRMEASTILELSAARTDSILRLLKPDVVLVEDLQEVLNSGMNRNALLMWLESINRRTTVVATLMDERTTFEPHSLAYSGIRPGRFDTVVVVPQPNAEVRETILRESLGFSPERAIVDATEGMSAAYLCALADNISAGHDWRDALRTLRLFVPEATVGAVAPKDSGKTVKRSNKTKLNVTNGGLS